MLAWWIKKKKFDSILSNWDASMHCATCMFASRVGRCDCTISECICCMKGKVVGKLQGFPCIFGMPSGRALLLGLEKVEDKPAVWATILPTFNGTKPWAVTKPSWLLEGAYCCIIDIPFTCVPNWFALENCNVVDCWFCELINKYFPGPIPNFWQTGFLSVG